MSDYITKRKNEYNFQLSQSLNKPETSPKKYMTILKTFYSAKKISLSLPLVINEQFITDFWERVKTLRLYFAKQYTPVKIIILYLLGQTVCVMLHFWQLTLRIKISWALDIKKAHGHDNISTGMILVWKSIACWYSVIP